MTPEQSAALIKASAELFGVVVWPAVIFYLVVRHRAALNDFFENLSEFSIKGAGIEATAKRRTEAAAALGAAVAAQKAKDPSIDVTQEARQAARVVANRVTPRTIKNIRGSRALWVDDNPENNVFERHSLESLGLRFDLSRSTDEALQRLHEKTYELVISDMGRANDDRAGYTLLDAMRKEGITTPFLIYSAGTQPEHVREARRHGAAGTTDRPSDLFDMVLSAIA